MNKQHPPKVEFESYENVRNYIFHMIFYIFKNIGNLIFEATEYEAGATFDNSFFDNCFVFLRQLKNRSFLDTFTVHKKVEIAINRT